MLRSVKNISNDSVGSPDDSNIYSNECQHLLWLQGTTGVGKSELVNKLSDYLKRHDYFGDGIFIVKRNHHQSLITNCQVSLTHHLLQIFEKGTPSRHSDLTTMASAMTAGTTLQSDQTIINQERLLVHLMKALREKEMLVVIE